MRFGDGGLGFADDRHQLILLIGMGVHQPLEGISLFQGVEVLRALSHSITFFLTTVGSCVFMQLPFGKIPGMGRRKMENIKSSNYGFWFYYFYAPVCPLLRRT